MARSWWSIPIQRQAERIRGYLAGGHQVDVLANPADAALAVSGGDYELVLVSMALGDFDPLRVCSQMRTAELTRTLPIILIAEDDDRPRVVRGLDLGVNDFIMRPVERNELLGPGAHPDPAPALRRASCARASPTRWRWR